jgi:hypothetical protein
MKRSVFFTAMMMITALSLAGSGIDARAEDSGHKHGAEGAPEKVTVVGEVIDPVCYIRHDSKGMEHKKCAEYCAKLGITLAILNEKDDEVLLAFPEGHTDPNEKLVDYIARRVKVTGIIHERGGLKGIEVVSIEPAK